MIEPRRVGDSAVTMSQLMMPGDANPSGNVHGGVIMKLVDSAAGVVAIRHARARCVTARIDSMSFLEPVYIGDLLTLKASVNLTGTTSMEVGVRVEAENLVTGVVRHVSSAYLVLVALDANGKTTRVAPLIAETPEEQRRLAEARLRRSQRQRGEEARLALRHADRPRELLRSWRNPNQPVVLVGHRGAAGEAPENTLPSFELALAQGVDAIETDVHLSRDGVLIAMHDQTVDRTTNGHGRVGDLTAAEIQSLDASGPFGARFGRVQVPTLAEVLAWAKGKTRVVIELKGTDNPALVRRTLDLVQTLRLEQEVLLISFDHLALKEARALDPAIYTGALYVARPADAVALATSSGADLLGPNWELVTADLVAKAHEADLAVSVWTVDQPAELDRLLRLGVDAVTTNFPDRLRPSVRGAD